MGIVLPAPPQLFMLIFYIITSTLCQVFPELRKQREERERFNRLGARVKSEAELEEIADGLHEQEHEDKKMRSLTVVPPLLRDPSDATPIYIDTNSE